ncbi:MAG: DUF63 family protein [Candidatus Nanoarchaeia archaeon]
MFSTFLEKYFIQPIYADTGYNVINTITYSIIAISLLFAIYKFFKKISFKIDKYFLYSLIPFIVLGSSVRVAVDAQIYKIGFWTVSPGLYLAITGLYFTTLILLLIIEKTKKNYWMYAILIGAILNCINVINIMLTNHTIKISNYNFAFFVFALTIATSIVLWQIFTYVFEVGKKYFWPFPAHMLDASSTFVAVDFLNALEKHPLPTFFINLTNTAAMQYVLKLAVLIPLIYFLNKYFKDKDFINFIAIAVTVLGLAEGMRNFLAILFVL